MKYLYLTLSFLIIAYIVLIIFIYFYQRNLLYHPSENNYQNDKIQFNYDEIFIKVNDEIEHAKLAVSNLRKRWGYVGEFSSSVQPCRIIKCRNKNSQ